MLTDSLEPLGPIIAGHTPLQKVQWIRWPATWGARRGPSPVANRQLAHCGATNASRRIQTLRSLADCFPRDHLHTAFAVGYWNGKFTLRFVASRENDCCRLDTELLTSRFTWYVIKQHAKFTELVSFFFILGAFAKLRKATLSIVMSICPSA